MKLQLTYLMCLALWVPGVFAQNPVGGDDVEFTSRGDFDGDGLEDMVVVDRLTGQFRIGYQDGGGFVWSDVRATGLESVSGMAVGRLLHTGKDALAVTHPEANRVMVVAADSRTQASIPVSFSIDGLGPNSLVAVDAGASTHDDLLVGSLWNDLPDNGRINLVEANGSGFTDQGWMNHRTVEWGNRLSPKKGTPALAMMMARGSVDDTFYAYDAGGGMPLATAVLTIPSLPQGSRYAVGYFSPSGLATVLTWIPGDTNLTAWPVTEPAPGTYGVGSPTVQVMADPIDQVTAVAGGANPDKLLVLQDAGAGAELFDFTGVGAATSIATYSPSLSETRFTSLSSLSDGRFALGGNDGFNDFSARTDVYADSGSGYALSLSDSLPAVYAGAAPGSILLFENEPFVNADPHLVRALHVGQWSTDVNFSGGNVNVTHESYVDSATGLANPAMTSMGARLPAENFALVSQYRSDVGIAGFSRAAGTLGLGIDATPASGTYAKIVEVTLTASDPGATIYYRLGTSSNWQVYNPPLFVFTDSDLYAYARLGANTSMVSTRSYRFHDNSGNLDSDNDGVPDYVELANGLDPVDSGIDSDGDGFSDLEELVLGSDPTSDTSTPSGWTPTSTSPRPSLEQQADFNIVVTPKPLDGTTGATTTVANDESVFAHDPQGNALANAVIGAPPAKRAELVLWLDASSLKAGDGNTVSRITDRTGAEMVAAGSAPSFIRNGPAEQPALRFSADNRLISRDPLTLGDYTLMVVFREHTQNGKAALLSGAVDLSREEGQQWGQADENGKRALQAPFPAEQTHVLSVTRQQGRLTMTRDGLVVGTARTPAGITMETLGLGGFDGEISELLLYSGPMHSSERQAAHSYLMSRYQKRAPLAYLHNISTDAPLVILGTEEHYNINTPNTDTLIGRELIGAVGRPLQSPVAVSYSYGGGGLAGEAANWVSAASAAFSGTTRTTITTDLEMVDTLSLLILEQKVGDVLFARGELSGNQISLTPHRPSDINRTVLSAEQLTQVEQRDAGVDNGFKLSDSLAQIKSELQTSSDTNVVALLNLLTTLYDISSEHHNTPPAQYRLPIDVLRDFIGTGKMDAAYTNQAGFTHTSLSQALAGVQTILGNLPGRSLTTFTLEVTPTSFSGACTILATPAPASVPYSLFDDLGRPYSLLKAGGMTLVPGVRFNVTAYTDSSATACAGEAVLDVISISLIGAPLPESKRRSDDTTENPDNPDEPVLLSLTNKDLLSARKARELKPNPAQPHEPVYETRLEVLGEEGVNTLGAWWIEDTTMVGENGRGQVEYVMAPEVADIYRLEVELAGDQDQAQDYSVRLWIDDAYLGRHSFSAGFASAAKLHVILPYLDVAEHTVRVFWDDLPGADPLTIVALRLQERLGEDSDGDGLKDWAQTLLHDTNYVDVAPMVSQISPAVIEGASRFASTIRVNDSKAQHALDQRWFARVPLTAEQPTTVNVAFENGAHHEQGTMEWMVTNVLEGGTMLLRAGDALRLTARTATPGGRFQMRPHNKVLRAKDSQALVWRFNEVGTHTIEAAHISPNGRITKGSLTVITAPAKLPDAALWVGNTRKWDLRDLPNEVVLEADDDIELRELAYLPKGGRRTELFTETAETRHVVARLGAGGPLLDAARVDGFEVFTANETYVQVQEQHGDGSQTIAIGLVAAPLPQDAELRLTIIVGGVTFTDGTISKRLSASDFDALGQTEVLFNRSANAKTAVCHVTEGYQNHVYIGTVAQLREERQ